MTGFFLYRATRLEGCKSRQRLDSGRPGKHLFRILPAARSKEQNRNGQNRQREAENGREQ